MVMSRLVRSSSCIEALRVLAATQHAVDVVASVAAGRRSSEGGTGAAVGALQEARSRCLATASGWPPAAPRPSWPTVRRGAWAPQASHRGVLWGTGASAAGQAQRRIHRSAAARLVQTAQGGGGGAVRLLP